MMHAYQEEAVSIGTCPHCGLEWFRVQDGVEGWSSPLYESDTTRHGWTVTERDFPLFGGACAHCAAKTMTHDELVSFLSEDKTRTAEFLSDIMDMPQQMHTLNDYAELMFQALTNDAYAFDDVARDWATDNAEEAVYFLRGVR